MGGVCLRSVAGRSEHESLALREHAQQILEAVAKDVKDPRSDDEQLEKSRGRAPQLMERPGNRGGNARNPPGRICLALTSTRWLRSTRAARQRASPVGAS